MLVQRIISLAALVWTTSSAAQESFSLTNIENADAAEIFVVHLRFNSPVTVGDVRTASIELKIPRVLAFVGYGRVIAEQKSNQAVIGLGEFYASETARQHSECRALSHVNAGPTNELRGRPIDDWVVSELNVYANAHVIRELLTGTMLPPATITRANQAKLSHLEKLAEYTRNEVAQTISPQRSTPLPEYCSSFLAPLDAPILAGGFPPGFPYPEVIAGERPKEYAFRLLAQAPSDSAVTISLKLKTPIAVDGLAGLVRAFEVRGMQAELIPEHSNKRLISVAELSTFGARPEAQVHRVRCQQRLGNEQPQASSEWYSDWISMSLTIENAVKFLSNSDTSHERVTGVYPRSDLERLEDYFDRLAERVYEMPKSVEIPEDCLDVYVHNDMDNVGDIYVAPNR